MNDRVYEYVNPLFKELLEMTPIEKKRESTISSGIAVRIAEILNRKGWNQADFAKAAKKKEAEISKWMSGQHNFTIRTIAFIETVLGEEVLSVKKYRVSAVMKKRSYSSSAPGLLNDGGDGKYSSGKK